MRLVVRCVFLVVVLFLLTPTLARAQATLAGVVKDASGAVMPGVTVEAASPALIEKVRSVASDGVGAYKIENLRPGTYTLTFTLTGFNTVKRNGVELTGTQTVTINAELRVGGVEQTIVVTGETPIVDVQSTTKQTVFNTELINQLPTNRTTQGFGQLVPGAIVSGTNVGGSAPEALNSVSSLHGLGDTRVMSNGVTTGTLMGGQSVDMHFQNPAANEEVAFDTAAVSADGATGGTRVNYIPRDGGNVYKFTFFGTYSNQGLQGSNFTQRVKDLGLVAVNSNKRNWDYNPGGGGPIVKDKLWFFATGRSQVGDQFIGGQFFNQNAGNPNAWTYVPDTTQQAITTGSWWDAQARLTWQANPKNKIALSADRQGSTQNYWGTTAVLAPEATGYRLMPVQAFYNVEWTAPVTSRVLLEAVVVNRHELWGNMLAPQGQSTTGFIPVTAQDTNLKYRGAGQAQFGGVFNRSSNPDTAYRFTLSYVTGAHSIKVGWNDQQGHLDHNLYNPQPLQYRVNNSTQAIPNQLTELAYPLQYVSNLDHDGGLYGQDRWALKRATITYALRWDWFKSGYPAQQAIPGVLFPNRNTQYPASDFINWKDLEPRFGVVYDVFGNGKTAARVTVNKYLAGLGLNGIATTGNPVNAIATSTSRTWDDRGGKGINADYVPQCDLLNPAANGECGPMTVPAFVTGGSIVSFSNNVLNGWGHRGYNWEFSTGVQQQIVPRVSLDVAYFRRVFGTFQITDTILTSASDYTSYNITAPVDPRLPGGGGYAVTGMVDVNPNKAGQVNNLTELDSEIGANQMQHWNGVDITTRARLAGGALLTGGISTGRQSTDNCSVVALVPETLLTVITGSQPSASSSAAFCHQDQALQTQVKFSGAYTLPRVGVLVSGFFQSLPGPNITATAVIPNAQIAPSLGRNLSLNAPNASINLVQPNTLYGERLNQLDLRFGKVFRLEHLRVTPSVDIFNALNNDTVLTLSSQYANWQTAQSILTARFVKFSVQIDY